MPPFPCSFLPLLALALVLAAGGCRTLSDAAPPAVDPLIQVNTAVNQQGRPCPGDACLDDWPEVADLERLDAWDCKAYAVAKADRLIRQHGYDPARLEYVLVEGSPLRVTHAALLVDGRWVLDSGLRCQVCALERFAAGLRITGRLPVTELPYVRRAPWAAQRRDRTALTRQRD
jgi:hypothetical protein